MSTHTQLSLGVGYSPALEEAEIARQARGLVDALDDARIVQNLSYRQLAARAVLPVSTVRSALAADSNPQLDTLVSLGLALGLRLMLVAEDPSQSI